jgi:MFS family permease
VFILDKYGRRKILYWGAVLQAIAMVVAGFCSKANDDGLGEGHGIAATVAVFAFTFFFGATWVRHVTSPPIARHDQFQLTPRSCVSPGSTKPRFSRSKSE